LLSSGHAVWDAEHGRPYFLAKAGIALTWTLGAGAAWAVELPRLNITTARKQPTRSK